MPPIPYNLPVMLRNALFFYSLGNMAISKDLKKQGMKFVGTTIIYSYLQAVGVIDSHEDGCFKGNGSGLWPGL